MSADPACMDICNLLEFKTSSETIGEVRKNYYASATPFYLKGNLVKARKPRYLLVARAGIEPATHGFSVPTLPNKSTPYNH